MKGNPKDGDLTVFCETTGTDARTLAKSLRFNEALYVIGDLSIRAYRNRSGRFLAPIIVKMKFFKFLGKVRDASTHIWVSAKGNLGETPDLKRTPKGRKVTNFNIAMNEFTREGDKETRWLTVTTWNKRAESCAANLTKGARVEVSGSHVGVEVWKTNAGEDRATLTLTAQDVEFLNRATGTTTATASATQDTDSSGMPWE